MPPEDAPQTVLRSPAFAHLEREARRLQRFLAVFLVVVALAPPSASFLVDLSRLGERADHLAGHYRLWVFSLAPAHGLFGFPPSLEESMRIEGVVSLRVFGPMGQELARAGKPGTVRSVISGTAPLALGGAAVGRIELEVDARPLLAQAVRIFGIHVMVALGLALIVFRLPVRAVQRAIRELELAEAQLLHSEKMRSMGEIYAGLTHEINNPLSIILSRVKLLLGAGRERHYPPEMVRDLELIDRHGSRIAEILRGLLAFSRKAALEPRETDLNAVVGDVLGLVEKPFLKHGIKIERALDPGLPRIQASPDHLQQVFLNLLKNAREAMPAGGTITLRSFQQDGFVVAEVRDTGTGFADDVRQRLFEPFFTTKDVGKGTGLGLSVSYGIVKAHRGEMEARGEPGQGAVFRVKLPLDQRSQ